MKLLYLTASVFTLALMTVSNAGYSSENKKEWDEFSEHAFTEDNRSVSSHGFSETSSARSFASHAFTQVSGNKGLSYSRDDEWERGSELSSRHDMAEKLIDIRKVRPFFKKGFLEITPHNVQLLTELSLSYEDAFQSYNQGVYVRNWSVSSDANKLLEILTCFSNIRAFRMSIVQNTDHLDVVDILERSLQYYKDLTELKVKDCRLTDKGFKKVLRSIAHKDKVKVLDLRGSSLSAGQFETIKQVFVNLTSFNKDEKDDQALTKDIQGLSVAATLPEQQDQGPVLKRPGGGSLAEKKVEADPKQDSNTISSNQSGLVPSVQTLPPVIDRSLPNEIKAQNLTKIKLSCGKVSLAGKTVLDLREKNIGVKDAEAIAQILKGNTTLTKLDLGSNKIGEAGAIAIVESLKGNTTLTTLNLAGNSIGDAGARAVAESLRGNTTLSTLELWNNNIGEAGAVAVAKILKGNTTLTKLHLGSNNIGDAGARAVAESLKGNITLTTLDLGNNKIGDASAVAVAKILKGNTTLTELYLWDNKIGEAGARAVAESLKGNTTLTTLNLGFNSIGNAGVIAFAESLKGNTTLTTLYLWDNKIGEAGARAVAESLKGNTTLTTLNLRSNNIGDAGAIAVAGSLKGNTTLTTLDLGGTCIGEAGAKAVAESLKGNTTLTTLNLVLNNIGDAGAKAVAESLKGNTTLTTLDLVLNNIKDATQQTIRELLKKNPNLKIYF